MAIFIRADVELTNPRSDNPLIPKPTITSDTFDGANGPLPASTNAKLGGTPLPWSGNLTSVAVSGGRLVAAAAAGATWALNVNPGTADILTEWTFRAKPVGGSIYLDTRRTSSGNAVRGTIKDSTFQLGQRVSGTLTPLGSPVPITPGDRLGVRVQGARAEILVNGSVVFGSTITEPSLLSAGLAGLAGYNDSAWALDDFVLSPA